METGRPQVLHHPKRVYPHITFPLILIEVDRLLSQLQSARRRRRVQVLLADFSVADELKHVRLNMVAYSAHYPAGMELRTHLGKKMWWQLEIYRFEVVKLAFLTRAVDRYRKSSDAIPKAMEDAIRDAIDEYIPEIYRYIRSTQGEVLSHIMFRNCLHKVIANKIKGIDDRIDIIDAIQDFPMAPIAEMFQRQPMYWMVYNFYFPVVGRMTWPQLARWAIRNLRQPGVMEPPAWSDIRVGDRNAISIWNRAELELILDIEVRFTSLGPSSTC